MSAARILVLLPALLAPGCSLSPDPVPTGRSAVEGASRQHPRTLTTRGLLPTSTRNLLIDPFVTADASWGHFVGVLLPVVHNHPVSVAPLRAYVSQAPAGVTAPVARFGALSDVDPKVTSLQLLAPFPGGSDPFDAQVWVAAGDGHGTPIAFDAAQRGISIAILPNDLATQAYPLAPDGAPPLVLDGVPWVRLVLPRPAPMPQGGWFSISIDDVNLSFQLQAPEVTPSLTPRPSPPPLVITARDSDRMTLHDYVTLTHQRLPEAEP